MKCRLVDACAICDHNNLSTLWNLPQLPLTEKYGAFTGRADLFADQELLFCNHCGHTQLRSQLAPEDLYTPGEYAFRTATSKTAQEGTLFFQKFFADLAGGRQFASLMDVGGNGLTLAKMTPNVAKKCIVDPVCKDQDGQTVDEIQIFASFIEDLDFSAEGLRPDLIFSRHVLEHIARPKQLLEKLLSVCHEETLYVFEIPCFEHLVEASRFDAIFHQHYHYFDLSSFQRLLWEVGADYVAHRYNRQGSCGGALLIAFRKKRGERGLAPSIDVAAKKEFILESIRRYQNQMELLRWQLKKFNKNIYGYGASLMLSTLGYHLKTDFSELICILDDDPQKDLISYQNVPVTVRTPLKLGQLGVGENQNFLITSLENVRGIYQNIVTRYKPRRVLVPMVI